MTDPEYDDMKEWMRTTLEDASDNEEKVNLIKKTRTGMLIISGLGKWTLSKSCNIYKFTTKSSK